jgi:hypothetical protein
LVVENSSTVFKQLKNLYSTLDMSATAVAGATIPAVAASTWYALYAVYDPVGLTIALTRTAVGTDTGTTANGSPVITALSLIANPIPVGSKVYMAGLAAPYGIVIGVNGPTSLTLNVPAIATASGVAVSAITPPSVGANYTYQAFVGMVKTDGTGNKYPLNMLQVGKRAELQIGGNVTGIPSVIAGSYL